MIHNNEEVFSVPLSSVTSTGNSIVAAPGAGKAIAVISYTIAATSGGATVQWKSDTTAITGAMTCTSAAPFSGGLLNCAANKPLVLDVAAGTVNGHVSYKIQHAA